MVARTLTNSPERDERRPPRQVACLIRVLEFAEPRDPGSRHLLAGLDEVELGRGESSMPTRSDRRLRLDVADARMSTLHARLVPQIGGWVIEDLGSRNGVFVNGAKLARALLPDGSWIELGRTAFVFKLIAEPRVPDEVPAHGPLPATWNDGFATGLGALARIAPTQVSIVLRGSTGTGKEVLARCIHAASRRSGPMIAVNCGALPDELVESELFGSKKGAFSGAVDDRAGLVRSSDGGTLLLDEIGDLPLATQAAFLRVLQEREVTPLGGARAVPVDLRVIAASHRDLEHEVAAGRFREDLLARLGGFTFVIPDLAERREDLGLLIAPLLARITDRPIAFTTDAARALLRYSWPRNVRELEQVLTSACALAEDTIELAHLPVTVREAPTAPAAAPRPLAPEDLERAMRLRELLTQHAGNVAAVARDLGVARMQVHRWAERYAIDLESYRA